MGDRPMADRLLKTDEVPIGVRDEELLDARFGVRVDAIPLRLRLHEERVIRFAQGGDNRLDSRDADLKVESPTKRGSAVSLVDI